MRQTPNCQTFSSTLLDNVPFPTDGRIRDPGIAPVAPPALAVRPRFLDFGSDRLDEERMLRMPP